MGKKVWVWSLMLFLVVGLVFTVSCAQKEIEPEPEVTDSEAEMMAKKAEEKARMEAEAAKRRAEEAERLRQQRERERLARERAEAERRAVIAAARKQFLSEEVYFDFDSSVIRPDAESVLMRKADWLRENRGASVVIEGHCDERGTNEYNLALGDRRATSAEKYLINLGIDASRLSTVSYGEERPVDTGKNEEAWAKNRRAHFVID